MDRNFFQGSPGMHGWRRAENRETTMEGFNEECLGAQLGLGASGDFLRWRNMLQAVPLRDEEAGSLLLNLPPLMGFNSTALTPSRPPQPELALGGHRNPQPSGTWKLSAGGIPRWLQDTDRTMTPSSSSSNSNPNTHEQIEEKPPPIKASKIKVRERCQDIGDMQERNLPHPSRFNSCIYEVK